MLQSDSSSQLNISGSKSDEDTGIVYIPVPIPAPHVKFLKILLPILEEEMAHNHERWIRGSHAITDPKWLQMYRPLLLSHSPLSSSYDGSIMHPPVQKDHGHGSICGMLALAKPTSSIQHLLHYPNSPLHFPSTSPKKTSCVLTSSEKVCIYMIAYDGEEEDKGRKCWDKGKEMHWTGTKMIEVFSV